MDIYVNGIYSWMDGFRRKGCAEDLEEARWRDINKIIHWLFKSAYEKGNRCEMSVKMDGTRNALSGQKCADFRQGLNSGGLDLQPPTTRLLYNQEKETSLALVLLQLVAAFTRGGLNLHHQ